MSLRTPTSPKNVSVFAKIGKAARSRIAQIGLAAGISVAAYSADTEAQERPTICVAPDGGAPVPCPGGTELSVGPRPRTGGTGRTRSDRPVPSPVSECGDSSARTPVSNVDSYLRDPVIHARIERMHPGIDLSHAQVYTLNSPVSVTRQIWDEGRVEARTESRTLPVNTRVVGVRVNESGHYDANGRRLYLVLDTNCGDVISGIITLDVVSTPVVVADAGSVADASADASVDARSEEPSRVHDLTDAGTDASTDAGEGDAANPYAPPPEPESRIFGGVSLGLGVAGGLMGTARTETAAMPDLYSLSGSCRPENPGMPTMGNQICTTTVTGGSGPYMVTGSDGVRVVEEGDRANRTLVLAPNQWRTVTINGERQDVMVDSTGRLITREGTGSSITRTTRGPAATLYAPILELALGNQWRSGFRLASYTRLGLGFTEGNPFLWHISERIALGYGPTDQIWNINFMTGLQIDTVTAHTDPIVSVPLEVLLNLYSAPFNRDTARFRFGFAAGVLIPATGNRGDGAWPVVPEASVLFGFER